MRRRLLAVAELAGMAPENHPKYFVCAKAEELIRRGFAFYKDGDDDERDKHYSVDLGTDATRDEAERFLGAWPAEERDQLWCAYWNNVVARIRVYYPTKPSVNYVTSSFSATHGLAGPNVYLTAQATPTQAPSKSSSHARALDDLSTFPCEG